MKLTTQEKRQLRQWAARASREQIACRIRRGSHWWPDLGTDKVRVRWDPKQRRYALVGYCQAGCGCSVEYPVGKRDGVVDTSAGRIVYSEGYNWTEKDGNPGGAMNVEAKGILRKTFMDEHLEKYGLVEDDNG